MKKDGQMEITFGMIFSIIIIIVTVSIAFYVIWKFVQTEECINVGFFFDSLDKKVDSAYKATIVKDSFSSNLPSGITAVCFGELDKNAVGSDLTKQNELKSNYATLNSNANIYFYPLEQGCGGDFTYHKVAHVTTNNFFCVDVKNEKITISLEKGAYDALVKLSE
ncbi:MAG: hypothetical protein Q8L29_01470 [archaeon]|nr:hypothetical protein [archaeon]